jgi:hypothetical protein
MPQPAKTIARVLHNDSEIAGGIVDIKKYFWA